MEGSTCRQQRKANKLSAQDLVVGGVAIRRRDLQWAIVRANSSRQLLSYGVNVHSGFVPIPGAAGYQVGNPSALALTAVIASLEIFSKTSMKAIRGKSVALTGYLEQLLLQTSDDEKLNPYRIITPSDPNERGAQLSVRLDPGLLEGVMAELESAGVVVDERKPDVIRVAPAPLYNTYIEVWEFVQIFKAACTKVKSGEAPNGTRSVIVEIGGKARGWSQVE